nr:hypothetical protein [Candidatus Enterousia merdequi]
MKKFHRHLNIMSVFTAILLITALIFWRTFLNIAITNVILNGIIIGTAVFGIGLCFKNMFDLLPEHKWLHAYFDGKSGFGFTPKILRPVALALHNRHLHITTTNLSEILDLVSLRMEDERERVRYVTNTLIFLGLLGTFWGLILTVGGFADLLLHLDFENASVLQEMQVGMAKPLSGMATAFTSSLLGLAGSLTVGFLGLQLQFAQNTMFNELTDFMTQYVLQKPGETKQIQEITSNAPVNEDVYNKISTIYDSFTNNGYEVCDLIRIDGKYPAVIAIGSDEKLFIATLNNDFYTLQNMLKRIELCFADTLEGINIDTRVLCVSNKNVDLGNKVIRFASVDALDKYLASHPNIRPKTKSERDDFNAYSEYIGTAIDYLFKPNK